MKIRSVSVRLYVGLLLAASTLALSSCRAPLYYYPEYNTAGRATPPSGLLYRVMAAYTTGVSGGLEMLDGERDLRGNVQNTITHFTISGYSELDPVQIINYPEETTGYVFSSNDGALTTINYSKETSSGTAVSFGANAPSAAASVNGVTFLGASQTTGQFVMSYGGGSYAFSLPNVDKVVVSQGNTVMLAMVKNSNTLYRVVKLPATTTPVIPPGSVDCEPLLLPTFCIVPVNGTFDRPHDVYFSLDGTTADVLNSGPEAGGTTASVAFLKMSTLDFNNVPTASPDVSAMATLPVANPVLIPGGVTVALSDSNYLYLAGQQLQGSGLFAGNLTLLNLSTYKAGSPVSISDGTHTRLLFADDNTLWVGSTQCANGVRAYTATQELNAKGVTDQAGNYNCLTMVTLNGTSTPTAQIVPAVTQNTGTPASAVTVAYPNTDDNLYYYGSATGICWVQGFHKVFTAYGGQIHAFYTGGAITDPRDPGYNTTPAAGTEINNYNITIQGTVLDVAYMDALTNSAN
ncbi:hypothetical protein [Granulicella paludicola]|uniref:hypothetical protein n=1 Tax=Granulicella paludicola TaxID=474951 RepID=UPI0021E013C5|nr:hypothetical protein [Granulicella paludicola]